MNQECDTHLQVYMDTLTFPIFIYPRDKRIVFFMKEAVHNRNTKITNLQKKVQVPTCFFFLIAFIWKKIKMKMVISF